MTLICLESWDGIATADLAAKGWATNGTPTVSTTQARTGNNALLFDASAEYVARILPAAGEHATMIVGSAIYVTEYPSGDTSLLVLASDAGTNNHVTLAITSTGGLSVHRGSYSGATLGSGGSLPLHTWCFVELKAALSDSTGTVDVRVNGASVLSLTGQDTKSGGTKTVFDCVRLGTVGPSGTVYFDDTYIANAAGSVNNTFLGDMRVRCLVPNGNGNSSQLTGSDGNSTDNYLLVDDLPPATSDYVGSPTADQKDTYAFTDLPDTSGTVLGAQIGAYATKTDSAARSLALVTRSGGTDYDSSDNALALGSNLYVQQMRETDPATSAAWLRSAVNSAEFGVKVR